MMKDIPNRNNIGEALKELGLTGNGIEIGVAEGKFSKIIIDNFPLKKIFLLDLWKELPSAEYEDATNSKQEIQDKRYNMVLEIAKPCGDKVTVIRKDSRLAPSDFEDNYFDFIYIDANHKYEYVKADLNNWYPKLRPGGFFSGHDYLNKRNRMGLCEVRKAVDEFCVHIGITPKIIPGTRRCPLSWYWIKP